MPARPLCQADSRPALRWTIHKSGIACLSISWIRPSGAGAFRSCAHHRTFFSRFH
ncbi:DUF995 domain-containing protein [Vreelandella olivaria]|uniref:DUF995 domain-containing protein n=1 Tax=Vreelandella olivaria TaxID=390919 RepID=UPI003CC90ADC